MNECVKENKNPAIANELVEAILNNNIADQNEIIELVRRRLADERNSYIKNLASNVEDLSDQIARAEETLKTIIVGELK